MKQTTQVRANFKIDDALILDMLREKYKKPLGEIISEMFKDSPKWKEAVEKFEKFRNEF